LNICEKEKLSCSFIFIYRENNCVNYWVTVNRRQTNSFAIFTWISK